MCQNILTRAKKSVDICNVGALDPAFNRKPPHSEVLVREAIVR